MEKKFTSENFEAEVLKSEKPVLVDFYADWCGPCKMMAPAVEELANEQDDVIVGKLNVDFALELARAYKVMSIPTLILFKNGEAVEKRIGVQSKAELEALSSVCKTYELPLFMDGARLGYGLMSKDTDVTLPDIAKLCDVFYIGGTKVGALCGEAVVFTHGNMPKHFLTTVKQHGALNAKGRLLGVQFDTLFTDNLYFEISKHAIEMAEKLKKAFKEKGYQFLIDSPTNQIFVILDNEKKKELEKEARFGFWEKYDETHTVVRIATSWGTTEEELNALIELI